MAQIWEYIKIALMNIKHNKGRSILTMLGIIIGISSVILIITVGNAFKGTINSELNSFAGGQINIYSYGNNEEGITVEFTEEDIEVLKEKVPHIKAVTPQDRWQGTISGRKGDFGMIATFGTSGLEYTSNDPIIKGRYFSEDDYYAARKVCVLTESGARSLFGTTNVVGMTVELSIFRRTQEFRIVGIRQDNASASLLGLSFGETTVMVEAPMTVLSEAFGYYVVMNDLYIVCDGAEYSSQVASDTLRLMENRHDVRDKNAFQMDDFNDYVGQMDQILSYVTVFVVLVAAISLLVGGIGVMNIMLVSVTERTREIGIRKSLGARTGSIMLQFLSESAIITLVGGLIGIVIGTAGAFGICALIGFSAKVEIGTILGATLFSSAVGIFFGIYPAKKAAKLSPIDALRHE